MTLGLIITVVVAVVAQMTGAYVSFIESTGLIGFFGFAIVQVVLAVALGARIMKIKASTARVMFYVYAALMGFTLSSIFLVYSISDIGVPLSQCAAFFFVLTMFSLTTKFDMLKAYPILMVGLVVLIISQIVLMFVPGSTTGMRIICAFGLILFAGMTLYDAQQTRALFSAYEAQAGDDQEDLHHLRAEPVSRLREHVPVHPSTVRQPRLISLERYRHSRFRQYGYCHDGRCDSSSRSRGMGHHRSDAHRANQRDHSIIVRDRSR